MGADETRSDGEPHEGGGERDQPEAARDEERLVERAARPVGRSDAEGGRVRRKGAGRQRRRSERRPRRASRHTLGRREPEQRDERRDDSARGPEHEHDLRQPAREHGIVPDDEGAGGAVAPAVQVAKRLADERERDRRGDRRQDRRARERGDGRPEDLRARQGDERRHGEDERGQKRGKDESDPAHDVRAALPPDPHRREPGCGRGDDEHSEKESRAVEQEHERGGEQPGADRDEEQRERRRDVGVRRVVDGARPDWADERGRADERDRAGYGGRRPRERRRRCRPHGHDCDTADVRSDCGQHGSGMRRLPCPPQ